VPNVYIENKFSSEVIEMNISNAINTVSVSGSSSSSAKKTDYPTHILLNVFLKSADYKPSAPMPFY
jgi:hypothetical protein